MAESSILSTQALNVAQGVPAEGLSVSFGGCRMAPAPTAALR